MAKLPLENHALERGVLGSLLADTALFWQVRDRIRPELFTVATHQRIVAIFGALVDEGRELSIAGVVTRLSREENSQFSAEGYLATLIADEADPDAFPSYLHDLEDMWARREMARLGGDLIRESTEDTGLSAMERLDRAKASMEALGDPMGTSVRHVATIAQELLTRVDEASQGEKTVGLDVGLKGLQDLIGALMPGRLYTLAGPPGSGKSALAYQVGRHVAATAPVLVEEIEMEGDELVERDLAGSTGIAADRIERAALNNEEMDLLFEHAAQLSALHLYIDSSTSPTVAQVRSKAMRMKRLKGLALLIIDHVLYLASPDRKLGEFEAIRRNMQALKKLAKDLGIPVIVLAQLKKEFGDGPWQQIRRPNVGDLYGGSALEQESDVVIFVHREEYLLGRKEPDRDAKDREEWQTRRSKAAGRADLILGKRRGGKGYGTRSVFFSGQRVLFSDQWLGPINRPGQEADFVGDMLEGRPADYMSDEDRQVEIKV